MKPGSLGLHNNVFFVGAFLIGRNPRSQVRYQRQHVERDKKSGQVDVPHSWVSEEWGKSLQEKVERAVNQCPLVLFLPAPQRR